MSLNILAYHLQSALCSYTGCFVGFIKHLFNNLKPASVAKTKEICQAENIFILQKCTSVKM